MGHKRNTITPEEHKERFEKIYTNGIHSIIDINEAYFLYNDLPHTNRKTSKCGTCRAIVWNTLKAHYGK
jgi:hypothetical protein